MKNGPNINAKSSKIRNLVPPFTFHHLNNMFKSDCINKMDEENKVTGKYLLKDFFGRKNITIAHKTIALNTLKKFTIKLITSNFFLGCDNYLILCNLMKQKVCFVYLNGKRVNILINTENQLNLDQALKKFEIKMRNIAIVSI
ncbi:hypothetical protein [Cytobacillus praedii]|uniref:hypothetical protein n=1 Tax=Cytobacillus praedii TaxID=1742358 RepID=UPI0012FAEADB|nr:hypothetical protein [Cytobacillus praedii]